MILYCGIFFQHDCLPVRLLDLFHELAVKGSLQATENSLREVAEIIQNNEARNHKLHYEIAQILFRTAPADHPAVKFARKLLDGAIAMQKRSEYLGEKVRIFLQAGNYEAARALAFEAIESDTTPDMQLLIGTSTFCYVIKQ
ncbi:unnamed protein product [Gongylonema pulchrum]|uniref:TPR_REGION domain-containing protein n=1 Tax=Gongylonema pulchrum TaxID=637853 RepID=A0A183DWZ8_9BILA|nr:unnamed protein product [Gongylonema pulchrum]